MTTRFSRWLGLLSLAALLGGQPGVVSGQDDPKETAKKIQDIRKQIEDLRQQEQALLKLEEEQRKAVEEKKSQYAKVEIRGRLRKDVQGPRTLSPQTYWFVSFGEFTWSLDLGQKKDLLTAADLLAGKTVVLEGKVEGRREGGPFGPGSLGPVPVVIVESLKSAEK